MSDQLTGDEHADLLATYWDYETALEGQDLEALDDAFETSPDPVRADAGMALAGHAQISAFRATRPAPPARRVDRLHVRPLAEDVVALTAECVRPDGATTAQTQVWRRTADRWRICVAHVSVAPPPALVDHPDLNAWRVRPVGGLAAGAIDGPLRGLSVAVKDLFAVRGQRVGAGNTYVLEHAPTAERNAPAVELLAAAGASIAGIARTDELAFGLSGVNHHEGTVANPTVPGHLTGGSSSGPAAAVAARQADIGLGTDTAGSIRVPASYCGLYGLRLTHGGVDLTDTKPLAPTFDTVGLLTRDPGTLLAATTAVLGTPTDARIDRLMVAPTLFALAEPPTVIALSAALVALTGRSRTPVEPSPELEAADLERWFAAFRLIQAHEAWAENRALIVEHPEAISPDVLDRLFAGRDIPEEQLTSAHGTLAVARAWLAAAIPEGTALVLPSTSGPAPLVGVSPAEHDDVRSRTLRLGCLASLSGRPALSVPVGRVGTSPVGLSLIGSPGDDHALISLIERRRP